MTEKQKVYLIARAILNGTANKGDAAIIAETGVTIADLDKHYSLAETVIDKAMNKPERRPEGEEAIVAALTSWIDYYFPDLS